VSRAWLVTGASRGIGAAIARAVVDQGDSVALVARSAGVEALADELGPDAHAIRADLTDEGAAERVVAKASALLGGLDVLVNNAAMHRGGRIEKLDEADFDAVLNANLSVPFRLCKAAVPRLPEGGAIVNVGAVVGFRGFPGDSPYGSAKAGLSGLTLVLAIELAKRGVTVNMVVPGFTETEMTDALDERARSTIIDRIPLRRPALAAEIADCVVAVAGLTYMTGALVPVDGGLMAALGGR
jgi:NAD(P)-dependent dehydrogenase (short-subunit alcohol dehydrogenase family)